MLQAIAHYVMALVLAPLCFGVINRTKAFFGGRHGQPFVQPYYDLWKLLRKGAVFSRTVTFVFHLAPVAVLFSVVLALAIMPSGHAPAVLSFEGDFVLMVGLLGIARFLMITAALDTGSAFEGMGASREAQISSFAEPVLFLAFAVLAVQTGQLSLSQMLAGVSADTWRDAGMVLGLVATTLVIVALAENARIPVDDPNTHLELTMIHEVMILDHSGPDFAALFYASAVKLWLFAALVVNTLIPFKAGHPFINETMFVCAVFLFSVTVGVIESCMARLKLLYVPRLLIGAGALSVIAVLLVMRR